MTGIDPRPLLVMITGEPGSGKTSLGLQLAAALRVPFLSRDSVRGGLLATAGLWTNTLRRPAPREAAADVLVEIVETAARLGVTTVVEFVVTPQRVEALRRLTVAANCIVVLTVSADAVARARRRDLADPLLARPEVLAALGFRAIEDYLEVPEREKIRAEMQIEFQLPLLEVVTDSGYDPPLEEVIDWVIDLTRE